MYRRRFIDDNCDRCKPIAAPSIFVTSLYGPAIGLSKRPVKTPVKGRAPKQSAATPTPVDPPERKSTSSTPTTPKAPGRQLKQSTLKVKILGKRQKKTDSSSDVTPSTSSESIVKDKTKQPPVSSSADDVAVTPSTSRTGRVLKKSSKLDDVVTADYEEYSLGKQRKKRRSVETPTAPQEEDDEVVSDGTVTVPEDRVVYEDAIVWKVGSRVEAQDSSNHWYRSKITAVSEEQGVAKVHFDGWKSRWDQWFLIGGDRIRPLTRDWLDPRVLTKMEKKQKKKRKSVDSKDDMSEVRVKDEPMDREESIPENDVRNNESTVGEPIDDLAENFVYPDSFEWKVGESVEAQDKMDHWYRAKIAAVSAIQNVAKIHFDGWAMKWDQWFPMDGERVRAVTRDWIHPSVVVKIRKDEQRKQKRQSREKRESVSETKVDEEKVKEEQIENEEEVQEESVHEERDAEVSEPTETFMEDKNNAPSDIHDALSDVHDAPSDVHDALSDVHDAPSDVHDTPSDVKDSIKDQRSSDIKEENDDIVYSDTFTWTVDERVEAQDKTNHWYRARIAAVSQIQNVAKIHFDGWGAKYDQWFPMDGERVRQLTPDWIHPRELVKRMREEKKKQKRRVSAPKDSVSKESGVNEDLEELKTELESIDQIKENENEQGEKESEQNEKESEGNEKESERSEKENERSEKESEKENQHSDNEPFKSPSLMSPLSPKKSGRKVIISVAPSRVALPQSAEKGQPQSESENEEPKKKKKRGRKKKVPETSSELEPSVDTESESEVPKKKKKGRQKKDLRISTESEPPVDSESASEEPRKKKKKRGRKKKVIVSEFELPEEAALPPTVKLEEVDDFHIKTEPFDDLAADNLMSSEGEAGDGLKRSSRRKRGWSNSEEWASEKQLDEAEGREDDCESMEERVKMKRRKKVELGLFQDEAMDDEQDSMKDNHREMKIEPASVLSAEEENQDEDGEKPVKKKKKKKTEKKKKKREVIADSFVGDESPETVGGGTWQIEGDDEFMDIPPPSGEFPVCKAKKKKDKKEKKKLKKLKEAKMKMKKEKEQKPIEPDYQDAFGKAMRAMSIAEAKEQKRLERQLERLKEKEKARSAQKKTRRGGPTAYMLFCNSWRPRLLAQNPGTNFSVISKKLGEIWHGVGEKEKLSWKRKAKKMKEKAALGIIRTGKYAKKAEKITTLLKPNRSSHSEEALTGIQSGAVSPYKVTGTDPMDAAAHLKLLSESLSIIGTRLTEHKGEIAVQGTMSVLLDSFLCSLGPLMCLTSQVSETDVLARTTLNETLDSIAYIMPGL